MSKGLGHKEEVKMHDEGPECICEEEDEEDEEEDAVALEEYLYGEEAIRDECEEEF